MLDIQSIKSTLTPLFKQYKVKSAYLFGSYARGEADENSDVDIRIEKGNSPHLESLLQVCHFENDMTNMLNKPVHILTYIPQDKYSSIFRKNLSKDEVKIYGD
ncbi:MAG: nucleotidyltransferase domain-containing protein [Selenomonadaceae bacterium]|nr:nucleotidyltransferase domain-containing protein [Selenomonadaceae bacterium]